MKSQNRLQGRRQDEGISERRDGTRSYLSVTAVPPTQDSSIGGTEATYRADGRLVSTVDGYGNTVSYAYDLLGRPLAVTRQAAGMAKSVQSVTRQYDPVGRVKESPLP